MFARLSVPAAVFAVCAGIYAVTLGPRIDETTPDAHFVHLADSYLHGQLHVVGNRPPTGNDWALYDGRWYVSFPPLPAVLLMPAVAIWGTQVWDRLFWAIFAGLGPALLFVLLGHLRNTGRSQRSPREDLALTALFALGTVYYYTSVQGSVWFAAHVVTTVCLCGYVGFAVGARHPSLSGMCLGLSFLTRPTTLLLAIFFAVELLAAARPEAATDAAPPPGPLSQLWRWLSHVRPAALVRPALAFALPLLVVGGIAMALNQARFDDPFVFGHEYLRIRWRGRIDTWGLFNYHYLGRNLAVFLASLPWLSGDPPYVMVSRHGLALWFTTPQLLWLLWPRRVCATLWGLGLAAGAVMLTDLLYQNSGWIQFGYRFALDYLVLLFAMLAVGGRRFGVGFYSLIPLAIAINLFGAITFDRAHRFYDSDSTQRVLFQPD